MWHDAGGNCDSDGGADRPFSTHVRSLPPVLFLRNRDIDKPIYKEPFSRFDEQPRVGGVVRHPRGSVPCTTGVLQHLQLKQLSGIPVPGLRRSVEVTSAAFRVASTARPEDSRLRVGFGIGFFDGLVAPAGCC